MNFRMLCANRIVPVLVASLLAASPVHAQQPILPGEDPPAPAAPAPPPEAAPSPAPPPSTQQAPPERSRVELRDESETITDEEPREPVWKLALRASAPWLGALGGCGMCSLVPCAFLGGGLALLVLGVGYGLSVGGCGGVLLIILALIYAIVIMGPGLLGLGPLSTLGGAVGGGIGALLGSRPWWLAFLGSIPVGVVGVLMGISATAAIAGGVVIASRRNENAPLDNNGLHLPGPGFGLMGLGTALAFGIGPLTAVATASIGTAWILGLAAWELSQRQP